MPSDNWMDETAPSRRADPDRTDGEDSRSSQTRIPTRVWVFAFVAGGLLFALFTFWGLYLLQGRRGAAPGPTPTAVIWTATPSPIPEASPTPMATEPPADEEESASTPTAPGDILIGGYVEVSGTGGQGLSLRQGPGANYARMDVAAEGEVFIVVEGPQTAAGAPWWRIRDPQNEERFWWAVGSYLEPVPRP